MAQAEAEYTCEDCGESFEKQQTYASHRARCDGADEGSEETDDSEAAESEREPPQNTLASQANEIIENNSEVSEAAKDGDQGALNQLVGTAMVELGVGNATAQEVVERQLGTLDPKGSDGETGVHGVDVDGFEEYMEGKAERGNRSAWTADAYIQTVKKFNEWYEEHRNPNTAPLGTDVRSWCDHLAREEELAGSTIQRHFHGMKAYFDWEGRKSEVVDIGSDISEEYPDRSGGTPEYFDWDEITALREAAAENPFDRALVQILSAFGVRIGELVALDVDDILWDESALRVNRQKRTTERVDKMFMVDEDKNILRSWLSARDEYGEEAREDPALFITPRATGAGRHPASTEGYRVGMTHIRSRLDDIAERAGIDPEEMYPHKFRDSVASKLANEGFGTFDIKQYLGHARQDVTERYMALSPERFEDMRRALA